MQLLGVLGWSRVAGWGGLPRYGASEESENVLAASLFSSTITKTCLIGGGAATAALEAQPVSTAADEDEGEEAGHRPSAVCPKLGAATGQQQVGHLVGRVPHRDVPAAGEGDAAHR